MVRADDLQEKAEDPAGLQRPADRDQQADAGELADALSELPEARLVRTSAAVSEVLAGADRYPAHRGARLEPSRAAWPIRSGTGGRELIGLAPRLCGSGWPRPGSNVWVEATLRRHSSMIRTVRRDFERLRPRRTPLRRQREGAIWTWMHWWRPTPIAVAGRCR
jgi:nitric oxide reductase NorD protein